MELEASTDVLPALDDIMWARTKTPPDQIASMPIEVSAAGIGFLAHDLI
jgi:hypothetical protein